MDDSEKRVGLSVLVAGLVCLLLVLLGVDFPVSEVAMFVGWPLTAVGVALMLPSDHWPIRLVAIVVCVCVIAFSMLMLLAFSLGDGGPATAIEPGLMNLVALLSAFSLHRITVGVWPSVAIGAIWGTLIVGFSIGWYVLPRGELQALCLIVSWLFLPLATVGLSVSGFVETRQ